jgi:hypothetical protein
VKNEIASKVNLIQSDSKYCIWIEITLDEHPLILGYIFPPPEDSEIHKQFDDPL